MWWIHYKVPGKDDETGEDLIQREDDKPESVLNRLEIFSSTTKPVLEFYSSMGICKDFKGTESKKIWPHVEAYLKSIIHWWMWDYTVFTIFSHMADGLNLLHAIKICILFKILIVDYFLYLSKVIAY